jgi:cobalamin biosynthesis protein CobD/CbiB
VSHFTHRFCHPVVDVIQWLVLWSSDWCCHPVINFVIQWLMLSSSDWFCDPNVRRNRRFLGYHFTLMLTGFTLTATWILSFQTHLSIPHQKKEETDGFEILFHFTLGWTSFTLAIIVIWLFQSAF